jgi:hypothetical protein
MAKKSNAVLQPNMGLYLDRARLALNPRMLADGLNFRVKDGKLSNLNMGWQRFGSFTLNGPVVFIRNFLKRDGTEQLVFATLTDLFKYVNDTTVTFLTPRYQTGTASRAGNTVTGVGTGFVAAGIAIGDEIHFGAADYITYPGVWDTITNVGGATTLTTAGSGVVGAGPYTIRKKFSGALKDVWISDIFVNASPSNSDELWMTNGVDAIVRWDGTATQVEEMTALGFTAKALVVYSNMMIFLNLVQSGTQKPTDMINSNPGEPQNVSSGLSEQFKVHGNTDPILRGEVIGDNLAIYSFGQDGAITLAQFVGDPLVFAFRQVTKGIGPVSAKAIANFGNFHELVAADGMNFFDGASVKSINRHIWREVLRTQDPSRIANAYAHFDEENGDLIWVIPLTTDPKAGTTGAPATAYTEHYLEDPGGNAPSPYSKRSFPFTATGYFKRQTGLTWDQLTNTWDQYNFRWNDRFFFSAFPLNLGGTDDGKIYTLNIVQDADGAALNSFVRFGRRPVSDGRMRGVLTRVYPFVQTLSTPLNVKVLMSDSGNGEPMITDVRSFDQTQPEGGHFTVHYRRGRYYEVEFGTTGPAQPWEIVGYDIDLKRGGRR